tara:strand:- start:9118 stop:9945 length:828 start_codon:yes stop_codon:yes gene_type:complete
MKIISQLLIISVLTSTLFLNAQNKELENSTLYNVHSKKTFLEFSIGFSKASFSDFATSPLVYRGNPLNLMLAHTDVDTQRLSRFGVNYAFGNFSNDFNNQNSVSQFKSLILSYAELYAIGFLNSNRLNIKIGPHLNTSANFRENEQLFNGSKGIEIIGTLFGSINATFIINKNSLPIKELFFNADIGLINSAFRNGYAYVGQGAVLNNDDFFDGYQFSVFSGARFSTQLGYTSHLKNHNSIRISYLWDAYRTSNDINNFQMAYHTLRLTFLFNLK